GKGQDINFYEGVAAPNGREFRLYLVDRPGYRYAEGANEQRRRGKPLTEGHLSASQGLDGVVQLVDARHGPRADGGGSVGVLAQTGVPSLFVLTKADQLSRRDRDLKVPGMIDQIGVDEEQVLLFSSRTGEGREELLESIAGLLTEDGSGSE